MAPGSHQTILTAPSSAMPIASLNHAAGLRDFCSGLSTQNYQASKSLRDSNWAEELSDNLDNTHHNPTSPNQPSPIETPKVSRWRAKGWKEVLTNFSNLLSNVKWDLTFWKPINASKTMHTLGIEDKDDLKRVAAFWVSEIINYAALSSLRTYNSRSGKLVCVGLWRRWFEEYQRYFQTWGILGRQWFDGTNDKFLKLGLETSCQGSWNHGRRWWTGVDEKTV